MWHSRCSVSASDERCPVDLCPVQHCTQFVSLPKDKRPVLDSSWMRLLYCKFLRLKLSSVRHYLTTNLLAISAPCPAPWSSHLRGYTWLSYDPVINQCILTAWSLFSSFTFAQAPMVIYSSLWMTIIFVFKLLENKLFFYFRSYCLANIWNKNDDEDEFNCAYKTRLISRRITRTWYPSFI